MKRPENGWMATEELDSFDSTLANMAEVVLGCLEAIEARSVAEVGAEYGLFTSELLDWADRGGVRVTAIDPAPRPQLQALAEARPELELLVATSHEALGEIELPDAVIIDGDHNYFTVTEELRLIAESAAGAVLPLILLHDIGWPLARRDSYHAPERIPAEHRQAIAEDAFLAPGVEGTAERGLYYKCVAAKEGGPRNGVLTAVEDFLSERPELQLAIAPPFFGVGVVWHRDAAWAERLAAAVAPWDRNPLLERLEAKRVAHLVAEFEHLQEIDALVSADYELRYEVISRLLPIYESGAFSLAERISRLRQRGNPNFSRDELGALLADLAGDLIDLSRMPGTRQNRG